MPKAKTTWILVADGSRARILSHRTGERHFAQVRDFDAPDARKHARDLTSDLPGRSLESANAAHHAMEPRSDPHEQAEHAFLAGLAAEFGRAALSAAVDRVVVAAPPRAMAVLRKELDPRLRGKIAAELTKDLTKTPIAELPEHFADLLPV